MGKNKCRGPYPPDCFSRKTFDAHWQGCYDFTSAADGTPRISCKTTRECVKTYKTCYKMYRICTYRLFKVCSRCGEEFDYYIHRGLCPRCR